MAVAIPARALSVLSAVSMLTAHADAKLPELTTIRQEPALSSEQRKLEYPVKRSGDGPLGRRTNLCSRQGFVRQSALKTD
jgi:hypothetical protein